MEKLLNNIKEAVQNDYKILKQQLGGSEMVKTTFKKPTYPIDLLNKYIRESEEEVKKAAVLIDRQKLLTEQFSKELNESNEEIEKRKQQVGIATEANAEELVNRALQLQAVAEARNEKIQLGYDLALEQLNELEQKHEEMQNQVKDMHIKRLELMGKENILTMKEKMNKILRDSEFGEGKENYETVKNEMDDQEKKADDLYNMTVFDAKIQELAKKMKHEEINE